MSSPTSPRISINIVVYNGEKYIRRCLDSVRKQAYGNFEVNILDNNSSDSTREIVKKEFPEFNLIEGEKNLGMWPGQEELLKYSRGKYIVVLSVDVILNENFITEAVKVLERDGKIGAVQGKIYKFELPHLQSTIYQLPTGVIDTCGFQIFRSRRIINIGHGEPAFVETSAGKQERFNKERGIFAVEGAVPVFRKKALEDCRIDSHIVDPDFFWYGDDLDLAWRMRLFGWKQIYSPRVIAYHDRKTTKNLSKTSEDFIKIRQDIPLFKRRLDWRNTTLAIIKNDFISNLFRDLPHILWRQARLWIYFMLFEPVMFFEIFNVAKLLPVMLKRRGEIMRRTRVSAKEIRAWFK